MDGCFSSRFGWWPVRAPRALRLSSGTGPLATCAGSEPQSRETLGWRIERRGLVAQNCGHRFDSGLRENARRPLSISYSTTPKEKMSERASTASPLACSGDMYAAVPRTVPASVSAMVCVAPSGAGAVAIFASPKSSSFTPDAVTRILAGFKSRCVMFFLCAASSALAICLAYSKAFSSGRGPLSGVALDELHHQVIRDRHRKSGKYWDGSARRWPWLPARIVH